MPTLLWRVLSYVGYPDGMEPRYFWANERLGEGLLVTVEPLFIPEVMVLSGLVGVMSQLAGPLKKPLRGQPLGYWGYHGSFSLGIGSSYS
jgi:hypothetical protein